MLVIAVLSSIGLYHCLHEEQQNREQVESLAEVARPVSTAVSGLPLTESGREETSEPPSIESEFDISALKAVNEDCIGWLDIPGTEISYPVMHTPNIPEYYLWTDFDGNPSNYGVPFLDAGCRLNESRNLIVYGHNINQGEVFGKLEAYEDKGYFQEHSNVFLHTESGVREYRIFAIFRVNVNRDTFPYDFRDGTDGKYSEFLGTAETLSLYDTGTIPDSAGSALTLSTCQNSAQGGRLIVIAVEVSE